jgi:hypothetical protein
MVPELKIFCGFCAKGQEFLRVRLRKSSRIRSKTARIRIHKQNGDHHNASTEDKISLFIAKNPNIPSTN